MSRVYLDASVIIYFVEAESPFHAAAVESVGRFRSDPESRLATSRLSRTMLGTGFVSEEVERTGGGIGFNLAVPPSVVVFQKPPTEVGERLVVEVLDLPFNPLNVGHAALQSARIVAQTWRAAELLDQRGEAAQVRGPMLHAIRPR